MSATAAAPSTALERRLEGVLRLGLLLLQDRLDDLGVGVDRVLARHGERGEDPVRDARPDRDRLEETRGVFDPEVLAATAVLLRRASLARGASLARARL